MIDRLKAVAGVGVILSVSFGLGGEAVASPPGFDLRPRVTASVDGLVLDWYAPGYQLAAQADGATRITIDGYQLTNQPGVPQLPFGSILIALPPDAEPTLELLQLDESQHPLPERLAIVPIPEGVLRDASGKPIGGAYSPVVTAEGHQLQPIELQEVGIVRGVRLARVMFYPLRPTEDGLQLTTHLRAAIAFNSESQQNDAAQAGVAADDPILATVRDVVVNPDHVQPMPREAPAVSPGNITAAMRASVEVNQAGLTAVTYEALSAIGFPVGSVDPGKLHLTRAGVEIAAEWDGDGDAAFEPGERLLFYAAPRFSRYSNTDVYFLSAEATSSLRMSSRSVAPAGSPAGVVSTDALAEVNQLYTPQCYCGFLPPGRDGDRWTWDALARPGHSGASYPIQLPTVDATRPATLTLWLIGYTDVAAAPDHRVDVALNNTALGYVEWNGKRAITATLPISPGILLNGANALSLTLPGLAGVAIDGLWLDAFSVRYARGAAASGNSAAFNGETAARTYTLALTSTLGLRVYDVTDADHPTRLTGATLAGNAVTLSESLTGAARRYALHASDSIRAPAALRMPTPLATTGAIGGANYVILAPAGFMSALGNLIALRQSQGLSVAVEDVQAIYDAFGDGRVDPFAIRAYLADAYAGWSTRPTYVLLVGDGTFDPKRYRTSALYTFIPALLADVDPWIGETATDNRYVTVDGSDALPDMLVGRLPVNSLAETQAVVAKIVQYETAPFSGAWHGRAIFAADDADAAGNFPAEADYHVAQLVTATVSTLPIYYTPPSSTVIGTHQAILDQWHAGAGLVMYIGHSSQRQWAAERLFHMDDVSALANGLRLPVVLEMTCLTGSFHDPTLPTLDETLLRNASGGAVAAWGATGFGVSTGHTQLASGFLTSVYLDGQTDLGLATQSGKLALAATYPYALDLLDTFVLLGDPATQLRVISHDVYVPFIRR